MDEKLYREDAAEDRYTGVSNVTRSGEIFADPYPLTVYHLDYPSEFQPLLSLLSNRLTGDPYAWQPLLDEMVKLVTQSQGAIGIRRAPGIVGIMDKMDKPETIGFFGDYPYNRCWIDEHMEGAREWMEQSVKVVKSLG